MHFVSLFLSEVKSARLPNAKPKAPRRIDFPAPVSPVIIENPEVNGIESFSMRAKFSMYKEVTIVAIYKQKSVSEIKAVFVTT